MGQVERTRRWRRRNPDKVRAQSRRAYLKRGSQHAKKKQYMEVYRLRYRYGITSEDFARMLAEQDGRCAICRQAPLYRLHVDHNHLTEEVRGLLCQPCNTGLTYVERPGFLESALEYLGRVGGEATRGVSARASGISTNASGEGGTS